MKEEQYIFKITIKRLSSFEIQTFYVIGSYAIAKSDRGISLAVVENFIFSHEHGGGAYGKDWQIESVEDIGGVYELMQKPNE